MDWEKKIKNINSVLWNCAENLDLSLLSDKQLMDLVSVLQATQHVARELKLVIFKEQGLRRDKLRAQAIRRHELQKLIQKPKPRKRSSKKKSKKELQRELLKGLPQELLAQVLSKI